MANQQEAQKQKKCNGMECEEIKIRNGSEFKLATLLWGVVRRDHVREIGMKNQRRGRRVITLFPAYKSVFVIKILIPKIIYISAMFS